MRKSKWIVGIAFGLTLTVCIGLLIGGITLYNDIFPKAAPIQIPEKDAVISATVGSNTSNLSVPLDTDSLETLLAHFARAKPTRKQSLNDTPSARPYFRTEVKTANRQYCYFVYEEDGRFYIEMAYEGIYETGKAVYDLAVQYFQP